jgi:hypothetical protein
MLLSRYKETTLAMGIRPNGGPQGHPAVCAIVNLTLDQILIPIRRRYQGCAILCNYSDDLAFVGPRETVRAMRREAEAALNAHGVMLNPTKSRATHLEPGAKTVILGFEFEWKAADKWPTTRPKAQAYLNLSDRIAAAAHVLQIQATIKGWKAHYDMCNDPDHRHRTFTAVNEGFDRHIAGQPKLFRPK